MRAPNRGWSRLFDAGAERVIDFDLAAETNVPTRLPNPATPIDIAEEQRELFIPGPNLFDDFRAREQARALRLIDSA